MDKNHLSRRDVLKVLGVTSAFIAAPRVFKSDIPFRPTGKINDNTPNILIMVFDAFSASNMSLYGYKRKTTPNIEKFAARSTVYHHCYSSSNFTHSSTASLLTGTYPWSHRALDFYTPLLPQFSKNNLFSAISSTYYSTTYSHNPNVYNVLEQFKKDINYLKPLEDLVVDSRNKTSELFENDRPIGFYAFKQWRDHFFSGVSHSLFFEPSIILSDTINTIKLNANNKDEYPFGLAQVEGYTYKLEDTINWLINSIPSTNPPFLSYVHVLLPHEPYSPRIEFIDKFKDDGFQATIKPQHFFANINTQKELDEARKLYDEYILLVDDEFGRLVDQLEKQGGLDNTYIILTSDHGQMLERGVHGHLQPVLYDPAIHVPLIIHAPGQTEGINIQTPVSLLDIVPTIVQISGQPQIEVLEGQVLPGFGGTEDPERVIFSMDTRRSSKFKPLNKGTFAAIQWPYKLITYRGYPGFNDIDELYNLENDPEEMNDLASSNKDIIENLKNKLLNSQIKAEKTSLGTGK